MILLIFIILFCASYNLGGKNNKEWRELMHIGRRETEMKKERRKIWDQCQGG